MTVGLSQELHASRFGELLQDVNNLGGILFKLLQEDTADTEGHSEVLTVLVNHIQHCTECREIAVLSSFCGLALVLIIIIIIMVGTNIKETITLQMIGLMYLKIKTNCLHNLLYFYLLPILSSLYRISLTACRYSPLSNHPLPVSWL